MENTKVIKVKCGKCDTINDQGQQYCKNCGANLNVYSKAVILDSEAQAAALESKNAGNEPNPGHGNLDGQNSGIYPQPVFSAGPAPGAYGQSPNGKKGSGNKVLYIIIGILSAAVIILAIVCVCLLIGGSGGGDVSDGEDTEITSEEDSGGEDDEKDDEKEEETEEENDRRRDDDDEDRDRNEETTEETTEGGILDKIFG